MRRSPITLVMLLCLAALPVLGRQEPKPPGQSPASMDPTAWKRAVEMTRGYVAVDAHAHDPFKPISPRFPQQVTLPLMRGAELGGLVATVPFSQLPSERPIETVLADLRSVKARLEADGSVALALAAADFVRARDAKRPAVMLAIEYFQGPLEGREDTLDAYHREGIRIFGLSGGGKDVVAEGEGAARSLSEFGGGPSPP